MDHAILHGKHSVFLYYLSYLPQIGIQQSMYFEVGFGALTPKKHLDVSSGQSGLVKTNNLRL
jgi:hypothetical protein